MIPIRHFGDINSLNISISSLTRTVNIPPKSQLNKYHTFQHQITIILIKNNQHPLYNDFNKIIWGGWYIFIRIWHQFLFLLDICFCSKLTRLQRNSSTTPLILDSHSYILYSLYIFRSLDSYSLGLIVPPSNTCVYFLLFCRMQKFLLFLFFLSHSESTLSRFL